MYHFGTFLLGICHETILARNHCSIRALGLSIGSAPCGTLLSARLGLLPRPPTLLAGRIARDNAHSAESMLTLHQIKRAFPNGFGIRGAFGAGEPTTMEPHKCEGWRWVRTRNFAILHTLTNHGCGDFSTTDQLPLVSSATLDENGLNPVAAMARSAVAIRQT